MSEKSYYGPSPLKDTLRDAIARRDALNVMRIQSHRDSWVWLTREGREKAEREICEALRVPKEQLKA